MLNLISSWPKNHWAMLQMIPSPVLTTVKMIIFQSQVRAVQKVVKVQLHKERLRLVQVLCFKDGETDSSNSESESSSQVSVLKLKKTVHGGRMYSKKQYCLYCSKAFCKMARHLERAHQNELEVAKALSFSKGSKGKKNSLRLAKKQRESDAQH